MVWKEPRASMPVVCHQSRELSKTDQDKTLYQNSRVIPRGSPTTQHSLYEGVSHIFPGRTTITDYLQKSTSSHEHIAARTGAKRCHWEWKRSVSLLQDFSEPLICYYILDTMGELNHLYYTVLYYTVLYCTILYHISYFLYYTVLDYTILHYTLHYTAYYAVLYYTVSYYITWYCIILYCI